MWVVRFTDLKLGNTVGRVDPAVEIGPNRCIGVLP